MSAPDTRWDDVRAWRARFVVAAVEGGREDLIDQHGKVAVFQHTLDDYDYLFAEIERLKKELSIVVSTRHKAASKSAIAKDRERFKAGMQRYAKGLQKYREQHQLDKDYIQRQKRELRRLNKLVPPIERALVSKVKVDDACPVCGCLWPATNHEALSHNLHAVVKQRDAAVQKLKAVVGAQRREAAKGRVPDDDPPGSDERLFA